MAKRNTVPQRVDPKFEEYMKGVAKVRLERGLAKFKPNELSMAEMTRLLTRTDGFRTSLEELKSKPKRRNGE